MKAIYPSIGLERLCRLFGKTRQAFYDHTWRYSDDQLQDALMTDLVAHIRKSLPKAGGLKLMHLLKDDFKAHNISVGRDSFFALLRKHDLLVRRRKRYAVTTNSNHPYKKWQDLVKDVPVKAAEQLWVSDITYLRTESGFLYLSLITDAWSRKIVGYHVSQHLKALGCLIVLYKAIACLFEPKGYRKHIHHSDFGI